VAKGNNELAWDWGEKVVTLLRLCDFGTCGFAPPHTVLDVKAHCEKIVAMREQAFSDGTLPDQMVEQLCAHVDGFCNKLGTNLETLESIMKQAPDLASITPDVVAQIDDARQVMQSNMKAASAWKNFLQVVHQRGKYLNLEFVVPALNDQARVSQPVSLAPTKENESAAAAANEFLAGIRTAVTEQVTSEIDGLRLIRSPTIPVGPNTDAVINLCNHNQSQSQSITINHNHNQSQSQSVYY
jgi:hypothetical protein